MFAASHMAVGALAEAGLRRRVPTAVAAFASAAILDSTKFWHAPYPWPEDSPVVLHSIPYPSSWQSTLTLIALVISTVAVGLLLRRYWWGMLWAVAPDIIDWLFLRPITGEHPLHDLFAKVSTPWGFGLEMAFIAVIVVVLLRRARKRGKVGLE